MKMSRLFFRALMVIACAALAGCSWTQNLIKGDKVDYRSQSQAEAPSLDIPPDLTSPTRDERFSIPGDGSRPRIARASDEKQAGARPASTGIFAEPTSFIQPSNSSPASQAMRRNCGAVM